MPSKRTRNRTSSYTEEVAQLNEFSETSEADHAGDNAALATRDADALDTEAETERLENTPLSTRKNKNIVLTPGSNLGAAMDGDSPISGVPDGLSSPSDASADESLRSPEPLAQRKRKRLLGHMREETPLNGSQPDIDANIAAGDSQQASRAGDVLSEDDIEQAEAPTRATAKKRRKAQSDRRRLRRARNDPVPPSAEESGSESAEAAEDNEGLDSQDDDAAADDAEAENGETEAAEADADAAAKNEEEVAKKKAALDSLTGLEKCFAKLRDKLFDERLASANEELALLQKPGFAHPELAAMKEAIDQHRNRKVRYQQIYLKYKLATLQKESVACKHQVQSQYMQTVRELRDEALNSLNKEFYRVQKERRQCEIEASDYIYGFEEDRSQQILLQIAYNNEVSVLAGVAKYVGFPAAPPVGKARKMELEDDFRKMGIPIHSTKQEHVKPVENRGSLPTMLNISKHDSSIEENAFVQRNAWANPQHPIHHQQRQQKPRQLISSAEDTALLATPVDKKRPTGEQVHGSASTLIEPSSGLTHSMGPSPVPGDAQTNANHNGSRFMSYGDKGPERVQESPTANRGVQGQVIAPEPSALQPPHRINDDQNYEQHREPNDVPLTNSFALRATQDASKGHLLPESTVKAEEAFQGSWHTRAALPG